jgi:EAL domain-containing protein (putative c-di-GMP-specific phosphodiesterase class I)
MTRAPVADQAEPEWSVRGYELDEELRRAIAEGQIGVVFQPQVAADSGRLVGAEALVRWFHPTRGVLSPADFLPLAEQNGLVVPIGRLVLSAGLAALAGWRRCDQNLYLTFNLSPPELTARGLADWVGHLLSASGVPAEGLLVELTEHSIYDLGPGARRQLQGLQERGVRLALDDFGTGYSNLANLLDFDIAMIKLDRRFVREAGRSSRGLSILDAVARLSDALGLVSVAEGVETPAELDLARGAGYQVVQGYLTGRPLMPDAFEEILPQPR